MSREADAREDERGRDESDSEVTVRSVDEGPLPGSIKPALEDVCCGSGCQGCPW